MKLFGILIPSFRKGTTVYVTNSRLFCKPKPDLEKLLNPFGKYVPSKYPYLKEGSEGEVVSMAKASFRQLGGWRVCYGILHENRLYYYIEDGLSKVRKEK